MTIRRQHLPRSAVAFAAAAFFAACTSSSPSARPTPPTTPTSVAAAAGGTTDGAAENVTFLYQRVPHINLMQRIGRNRIVVAGPSNQTGAAATAIHATGAKAFRYVQTYWYPTNQAFDGLEIAKHPDFAFCTQGNDPVIGRTDTTGSQWWFLDMNEEAVRAHFVARLQLLKSQGWDGVFFDRGFASLTGLDEASGKVWDRTSSCTEHPHEPGATFADSYVGILGIAHEVGLKTMFNFGVSPFDPVTPLRPDPSNSACQAHDWAHCATLDDAWKSTDYVLDEAVSHSQDVQWNHDFIANQQNEQNPAHGGHVVGLITHALLQGGDHTVVVYEWSRAKLFAIPVGINTGDAGCRAGGGPCNRGGLYPELTSMTLGRPIDPNPQATECDAGSEIHCIWTRRYANGVIVVNASPNPKTTSVGIQVTGCRHLTDRGTGQNLADGTCVSRFTLLLAPWSGAPVQYSETRS